MAKKYCAFWYPYIFHTSFDRRYYREEALADIDVSDNADSMYRAFLHIDKSYQNEECEKSDKADLNVKLYSVAVDGTELPFEEFKLTFEERSNNGFVIYSYNTENFDFARSPFRYAIYHHAKSFYHKHEINTRADSGLKAILGIDLPFEPKNILRADNEIIQEFLVQYESLFKEYAVNISDLHADYISNWESYRLLIENEQQGRSITNKKGYKEGLRQLYDSLIEHLDSLKRQNPGLDIKLRNNIPIRRTKIQKEVQKMIYIIMLDTLEQIRSLCERAMIEYTYCKVLLESKYNTKVKHNIPFTVQELEILKDFSPEDNTKKELKKDYLRQKDCLRKTAINIRSSVRYIANIRQKCTSWTSDDVRKRLEESAEQGKRARSIAILGIVLAIIGLALTVLGTILTIHSSPC